jgi:hypothetical protein
MQLESSAPFSFLIALCLVACGGSTPPAENAAPATAAPARSDARAKVKPSDDDASAPPAPKRAACDDGSCSPCGDAICPNGWYCDESAQGGPACGWLPECAKISGCACVKKAFAGCGCEEKNGAAHLACR